jgi:DNA-binding NarL/FixJ family response regulator
MLVRDFSNGKELLDALPTLEELPHVILMDLNMPEINGVEATKQVHIRCPQIKIIAVTSYNTKAFVVNMIQSGACSFLKKIQAQQTCSMPSGKYTRKVFIIIQK